MCQNEAGGRGDDEREKQPPHGGDRRKRAEVAVLCKFADNLISSSGGDTLYFESQLCKNRAVFPSHSSAGSAPA